MCGKNYSKWKTNLSIVLEYKRIKFVQTISKPKEHATNAFDQIKVRVLGLAKGGYTGSPLYHS